MIECIYARMLVGKMDETKKLESEIRQPYQTTIPQVIREKMGFDIGDNLI
jgi:bifunctional DNA-binding transcriptional regulator/antitoxin component of YhaV-PrlF toxin-antitoxin module